ncbi:hypothetical protein PAMC26510_03835 [Caballeronia sordidicola]|uniref:Uncharacterized protein n=1 Tax=Caballeronia sordidicola TaxID=196367 RepID=A0A242N8V6_CABSO|nr:hypothetical protein PAMC26510_03835 [Caballeronia sordidicola]
MHADMLRGRNLKSKILMRAVINPVFKTRASQMHIGALLPANSDFSKLRMGSRQTQREQPLVLQFKLGLFTQAINLDLPSGHHDVRMVIAHIRLAMRTMDGEIYRYSIAIGQVLRELSGKD